MCGSVPAVPIPCIIHQIWVGPRMPRRFREYTRTWQRLHPDWEYRLWTERELEDLTMANRQLFEEAPLHQPSRLVPRMRSNIARLEILVQHGGIYVDSDMWCLKPLPPLLEGVEAFAAWSPNGTAHLTNAVIGSVPRHDFFRAALTSLAESVAARPGQGSWRQTGPEHITRTYQEDPRGLTVFPSSTFYPVGIADWKSDRRAADAVDLSDAYAVHEWASQRRPWYWKVARATAKSLRLR